jgi:hypothetical protein
VAGSGGGKTGTCSIEPHMPGAARTPITTHTPSSTSAQSGQISASGGCAVTFAKRSAHMRVNPHAPNVHAPA